jgi:argininosuccinate lyase
LAGPSATLLLKKKPRKKRTEEKRLRDLIHSARLGTFSGSAAKYTTSINIDGRIVGAVIDINLAHVLMLSKRKIISNESAKRVITALSSIPRDLQLNELLEDVHMNIEDYVISKAGKEAGGMLNLAKSRNDQVSTALRIALRQTLLNIGNELIELQQVLLARALENASTIMPGYTHLQRAQPITLGHHVLAHEGVLERDLDRLIECYSRVNKSPMGAGALASTGFSIDRRAISYLLGFDDIIENSLDCVSSRDFAIESIYVCAQIMNDLSKLAEEIILWTSSEFSFAEISDEFAASSSMMPQKKNAVIPEIARARTSQVTSDLMSALGIVKALPLSYNLDLQELSRNMWDAVELTRESLHVFSEMMKGLKFNKEKMKQAVEVDETLFATEVADHLVRRYGIPFREAHARVAALIRHAVSLGYSKRVFTQSKEDDVSSILGVTLTRAELAGLVDPIAVLYRRTSPGSPNPNLVIKSCRTHSAHLSRQHAKIEQLRRKSAFGKGKLLSLLQREYGTNFRIKQES